MTAGLDYRVDTPTAEYRGPDLLDCESCGSEFVTHAMEYFAALPIAMPSPDGIVTCPVCGRTQQATNSTFRIFAKHDRSETAQAFLDAQAFDGLTARQLMTMPVPTFDSLPVLGRDNIVLRGLSHIVAASPKAGKTTLLAHAVGEWDEPVLWLSEEAQSVWQYRLANEVHWSDERLDSIRVKMARGITPAQLLQGAATCSEPVVIVDTIRTLLQLVDENDNSGIARVIDPWVTAMNAAHKTLILVHHNRKTGGENGEGIAGGHALLGSVDRAVVLTRDTHADNRRVIETLGRLVEGVKLVYERDKEMFSMRMLGEPSVLEQSNVQARIREVLRPGVWLTTRQIQDQLDPRPSHGAMDGALKALLASHKALRDPALEVDANGRTVKWSAVR
jgi:AAA domain-containing protein